MNGDGYLRLHPARNPIHSEVPDAKDALVFVDLDTQGEIDPTWLSKQIRGAKPGFFLAARHMLVRWPSDYGDAASDDGDAALREQAKAIAELVEPRAARRPLPVGIVAFKVGAHPRIIWAAVDADTDRDNELLARARKAEMYTLLQLGRGIWQARSYHYRLPSGEHSDTFVRVNDAFQRPRDPIALATWFYPHLRPDTGILIDSPTLVPLVAALHAAAEGAIEPREVAILTDYPSAQFEIDDAVEDLQANTNILAILSVSSSGSSRHRIANALSRQSNSTPPKSWMLETMVSRSGSDAFELNRGADAQGDLGAWLSLRDLGKTYRTTDGCLFCKDHSMAPTVYIDPRSFEAMALPRPELLVPNVKHATDTKSLWEFYNETDGLGIQCLPHPQTAEVRGNRSHLAIRCFTSKLLDSHLYQDGGAAFSATVSLRASKVRSIARESRFPWDPATASIIVTSEEDRYDEPPQDGQEVRSTDRFDRFLSDLSKGLGRADVWPDDRIVALPRPYTEIPQRFKALLSPGDTPKEVLVVTIGSVSGNSMEQMLVGLHDVTTDPVGGIVVHARPERKREWTVLSNAYNQRLGALWLTYLPWGSPFDDEAKDLPRFSQAAKSIEGSDDRAATDFIANRVAVCVPQAPEWLNRTQRLEATRVDPYAVFWGMSLEPPSDLTTEEWPSKLSPTLRPGSRFGQYSRALTTFSAVGAAVQWAREYAQVIGAPVWQQFEMPAVLRSYFDPIIIAAVFRWLDPHETWWGIRDSDAANVIAEALARCTSEDCKILLPELLLATIQGKVPRSAREFMLAEADRYIALHAQGNAPRDGELAWDDREIAPVVAASVLLRSNEQFGLAQRTLLEALTDIVFRVAVSEDSLSVRVQAAKNEIAELDVSVVIATDDELAQAIDRIAKDELSLSPAVELEEIVGLLALLTEAFE